MKNSIIKSLVLMLCVFPLSGCLSYMNLEAGKQECAMKKAIQRNDQNAIRAIRVGDDAVVLALDVSNWDALMAHPVRSVAAGIGDGLILWGAYEGVVWGAEQINGDNNNNDSNAGRDQTEVNIEGDGNNVNVGNTTSTDNSGSSGE